MDNPRNFYKAGGTVGDFDQLQAEAIEILRNCRSFVLLSWHEDEEKPIRSTSCLETSIMGEALEALEETQIAVVRLIFMEAFKPKGEPLL